MSSNFSSSDTITCPHCGKPIPITETLQHQLAESVRKDFEEKLAAREKDYALRDTELSKKERELTEAREQVAVQVKEQVQKERQKLEQEAKTKAESTLGVELKDLRAQVAEKDKKIHDAQEAELELRKRQRELEESKKALELEVEKRISTEREKLESAALKRAAEEHRLKDAEKEKQVADMRQQIIELKRRAEQGSQQTQGEILELVLEDFLTQQFPYDEVTPVPKGMRGADVLQKVNSTTGQPCGMIVWESKRTKAWSDGWITKLKDDQREVRSDIAVLVSEVLPKDIQGFGLKDGVWVADYTSIFGVALALRSTLIQVATTKRAAVGKNEKVEVLFNYLIGPEFRQKVEAIVETFVGMQNDLEEEKRAFTRRWARREKQIERVIDSTSGMYGDLQGLIGAPMQTIPALEAGEGDDVDDEDGVRNEVSP
jgi:hypothetical protein